MLSLRRFRKTQKQVLFLMSAVFWAVSGFGLLNAEAPATALGASRFDALFGVTAPSSAAVATVAAKGPSRVLKVSEDSEVVASSIFQVAYPTLSATERETLGLEAAVDYVQLQHSTNGAVVTMLINDIVPSTGAAVSRAEPSFESLDAVGRGAKFKKSLFSIQGPLSALSFKSVVTGGFLSVGKVDGQVSTLTDVAPKRLAGIEQNGSLVPSSYESFSINVLSEMEMKFLALSSKVYSGNSDSIRAQMNETLLDYTELPFQYQRIVGTALKASEKDKDAFLASLSRFVAQITSQERLANAIEEDQDGLFEQLIRVLATLDLTEEQVQKARGLAAIWERGYVGERDDRVPEDGKKFVILFGDLDTEESSVAVVAEPAVDEWGTGEASAEVVDVEAAPESVGPRVLAVVQNRAIERGVSFLQVSKVVQKDGGAPGEKEYDLDGDLLKNDPFADEAIFVAVVNGNLFGIKSMAADGSLLMADSGVVFDQNEYNEGSWKDAIAHFSQGEFFAAFGSNQHHLELALLEDGKYSLFHLLSRAYLSLGADGFLRCFKQQGDRVAKMVRSQSLSDKEKFTIVEFKGLHNALLSARKVSNDAAGNQLRIQHYRDAIDLIDNQWDLKFFVDDLARLVASSKQTKEKWDQFTAASAYMGELLSIIEETKNLYGDESAFDFKLTKKQHQILGQITMFLDGSRYPSFRAVIKDEAAVTSFYQDFRDLRDSRITDISVATTDSFIAALKKLFVRRVELDLGNSEDLRPDERLVYAQSDVADWLEFEVMYHSVILEAKAESQIEALVELFRSEYRYQELIDNLNFMLNQIPGFSRERYDLFVRQVVKATTPEMLERGRDEGFNLKTLKMLLRRGMANQLNKHLDTQDERGVSARQKMINLIDIIKFPTLTHSRYVEDFGEKIKGHFSQEFASGKDKTESIEALYDVASEWRTALVDAVFSDEEKVATFGMIDVKEGHLKGWKFARLKEFQAKLGIVVSALKSKEEYRTILPRFTQLIKEVGLERNSGSAQKGGLRF